MNTDRAFRHSSCLFPSLSVIRRERFWTGGGGVITASTKKKQTTTFKQRLNELFHLRYKFQCVLTSSPLRRVVLDSLSLSKELKKIGAFVFS